MTEQSRRTPKKSATDEHRWHLAKDAFGVEVTDLEYAVMRLDQSFSRWQSECMAAVTGTTLSGQENALLHVIHMHERPKTIRDLLHLTNRQDVANMQYELRKLIKTGFVEKYGSARTGVYYIATAEGARVCEAYARLRETVLLKLAEATAGIQSAAKEATACLERMERVYESATREVATFHRRRPASHE
jgi:predicted MarR family transcription regulator